MKTKFKVFTCVFLLIVLVASMGFAEGKSALPAYLLSFFVGFGTGHLYSQAEWRPWLAADAGALGVAGIGGFMMVLTGLMDAHDQNWQGGTSSGAKKTAFVWSIVSIAGITAYGIIRVIEFVDIFKVVKQQKEAGVIAYWSPAIDVRPSEVAAGLKYSY